MIKKLFRPLFFHLWRRIHREGIVIYLIHGVIDPRLQTDWQPLRRQLTVKNLDNGLERLAKYYNFISMDEAVAMLKGQVPLQPYSLVLTFDDGYRNNVTHALPILQQHMASATFFLSTGHVERHEPFWYDRLDYAIQHLRKEQHVVFAGRLFSFHPNEKETKRSTFTALRNMIKADKLPYNETMHAVNQIAKNLEDNAGCCLADILKNDHSTDIMSWEEVKCAADQGVTIGSHTVDHVILDRLNELSALDQMKVSKSTIEHYTGKKCFYFCYPSAIWNKQIVSMVQRTGYVAATTTDDGSNKIGVNLLTLHRKSFPEI